MNLQQRINLLVELGHYMLSDNESWTAAKQKASRENGWFLPEFIDSAIHNIANNYLHKYNLEKWIERYHFSEYNPAPKNIGIIMAGNIPLVGFHDFLSVFISGNRQTIKASSKDETLIKHLVQQLFLLNPDTENFIAFSEMLKGCDAYIATGSNNSARYFDYYFNKYPHIIRRNRSSVAILTGHETPEELNGLADDIYQYFGLGCRNVTKIFIPEGYDFIPFLNAGKKYEYLVHQHKYINNYDYQLAILLLNKKYYMSNGSLLLTESNSVFSPISVLNYEYYSSPEGVLGSLKENPDVQCIIGEGQFGFGKAQSPELTDYADGADTLQFLRGLTE